MIDVITIDLDQREICQKGSGCQPKRKISVLIGVQIVLESTYGSRWYHGFIFGHNRSGSNAGLKGGVKLLKCPADAAGLCRKTTK
jgi:hypothetical protein